MFSEMCRTALLTPLRRTNWEGLMQSTSLLSITIGGTGDMRGEVFRRPPGDFINEPPAWTYRNVPPSNAMTCATIDDPRFMTLRLPKGLTPP